MRGLLAALSSVLLLCRSVQAAPLTTDVAHTSLAVETTSDDVILHVVRTDDLFDDATFVLERMTHVLLRVHVDQDQVRVNDKTLASIRDGGLKMSTELVKSETIVAPVGARLDEATLAALPRGIVSAKMTMTERKGCSRSRLLAKLTNRRRKAETRRFTVTAQIIEDDRAEDDMLRMTSVAVPILEVVMQARTTDGEAFTLRAFTIDQEQQQHRRRRPLRHVHKHVIALRQRFRHAVHRAFEAVAHAPLLAVALLLKVVLLFGVLFSFIRHAKWPGADAEGAIRLADNDDDDDNMDEKR